MNFFLKAIVVLAAGLLAAVPTQAAGENHFTPPFSAHRRAGMNVSFVMAVRTWPCTCCAALQKSSSCWLTRLVPTQSLTSPLTDSLLTLAGRGLAQMELAGVSYAMAPAPMPAPMGAPLAAPAGMESP